MYATDIYSKRQQAGITRQRDLLPHLPDLPGGRRITIDFFGRIERCEVEISPETYNGIINAIDKASAERSAA